MLRLRLLGGLALEVDGVARVAPKGRPASLLAWLALHPGVHPRARLAARLWPDVMDESARASLRNTLLELRRALGPDVDRYLQVTRDALGLGPDERVWVDTRAFARAIAEGRLEDAVSLDAGELLAELEDEWALAAREDHRLAVDSAREQLAARARAAGDLRAAIAHSRDRVAADPLAEAPVRALIELLAAAGDRSAALATYERHRERLRTELAIAPSAATRELMQRVRSGAVEPAAAPPPAATPAAERPRIAGGGRRLVTIVVADLSSPALLAGGADPEVVHAVLDRCSALCTDAIERHGGCIERFVGHAAVGVFGLTELHEDDALRAVRAAVELRDAAAVLGAELERERSIALAARLGVDSGEVYVATGTRRAAFASGDAVDVATILSRTATAGEILIGGRTHELVAAGVDADPLAPLAVGGRTAPVAALRLLGLRADHDPPASPFVGRERELAELRDAVAVSRRAPSCRLVTVIGPPGIGKSRLARELADEQAGGATVLVGRCLSYGEGITYRPLAEIVAQLGGADRLPGLLEGIDQAGSIARGIAGALSEAPAVAQAEETFWAVRRLFEQLARERPLLVVVDDIHWAQPTLLDLLEYIAAFSTGARLAIVCLARPELLETRPAWASPQPGRSLLTLAPLQPGAADRLVETLGGDDLHPAVASRIVETGEGNPLFLEQLVAVGRHDDRALPPTIQAVLAARIDRLDPGERELLEHASIEGRSFHRGAVADLMPEESRRAIDGHLVSLVHKQLIRSDRPEPPAEDRFRFAHVLIRDVAYAGVAKERRAELHERMARWLERRPDSEDELVGYHFEQAVRYGAELGRRGRVELGAAAAAHLETAARAALLRADIPAGAKLLGRAVAVLAPGDPARVRLLPRAAAAMLEHGRFHDAEQLIAEAMASARENGDAALEARAGVERELVRLRAEPNAVAGPARRAAEAALAIVERQGDDADRCRAYRLLAWIEWATGQVGAADEAWRRAAEHATRAGERRELYDILGWRASAAAFGPMPVTAAIERCGDYRQQVAGSPVAVADMLQPLALMHAMSGRFEEAFRLVGEANAVLGELGRMEWAVSHHEVRVEMLAGRHAVAEERLRAGYDKLAEMGEQGVLATTAAMLARTLVAQDRDDEATQLCDLCEQIAADDDPWTQVEWRGVRARLLARAGETAAAEAMARDAVRRGEPTDLLTLRADVQLDLAEVLRLRSRSADAVAAIRRGLELYEQKGDTVSAERARVLLAELTPV